MEKLKMGLIGCGGMMSAHVVGVPDVEGVEIVAVCDILEEKAREVSRVLGGTAKVYTDYRDMADDVDAVMIALPHDLHFPCGMFFAQRNKHIMMEKPLCNTEEECLCLIEECEKRNLKLMCGYPVRYWRGVAKLKELIDTGDYGEIIQMSIWTEQLTGAHISYEDARNRDWMLTGRLGGGQLFSHGCHYIDLTLWFLGEPVTGAHIGTKNGTPWMMREGTSAVVMKFANGAIGYHGATWGARARAWHTISRSRRRKDCWSLKIRRAKFACTTAAAIILQAAVRRISSTACFGREMRLKQGNTAGAAPLPRLCEE